MNGKSPIAIFSGAIFASIFGVISPKIRTTSVMTAVETTTLVSPSRINFPKNNPEREVARILTKLLPTNTVEINLSYRSINFSTEAARLLPLFAKFFRRILFALVNAVSVDENNPDKMISTISAINRGAENCGVAAEFAVKSNRGIGPSGILKTVSLSNKRFYGGDATFYFRK